VLGISLVVVGIGTAGLWWVLRPQYRPGLAAGESFGVDVSGHQGQIEWQAVADDDIDFAFIKATEGEDFVDDWFDQNWQGAQAAGLDVGAYHFFTLCRPGEVQAANFLATVPLDELDLPVALDLEFPGNCKERPSKQWVDAEVEAFIRAVDDATDIGVLLYVDEDFDDFYAVTDTFAELPLWQRRILRRPGDDRWDFWQFSYFAAVDGISGGVDLNVRR
jgi:lysozyme